ncbi:MAG: NAD(P)H-quinone oxidoreductase [Caldilineaceae bacterium]|nr:NAD(P)H-quinone oxidoreductase [Caldilineaceae bacterium]
MKAIQVDTTKTERPLLWQATAAPSCGPDEVLVDIHATALNRADLLQRAGNYPPPPGASDILGLEMAGVIAQCGANVQGWQVGDRVCALLPGGGYAEQVSVPQQMLMPVPTGWSLIQAAGLPEVYLTAFVNLYMEANLQAGETVLVHGGASGVGTAAIQLLKASGNPVIITASSTDKGAACTQLGAELAINYRTEDFVERALAFTAGQGVDVIMDMVGADYLARNLSLLKLKGRLVFISTLSGTKTEIDLRHLMGKRLRLIGSVLRSRTLAEKITIKENFMTRFWPAVEAGLLQPVIDRIYPITQANEAHQRMAENRNIGKLILQIRD